MNKRFTFFLYHLLFSIILLIFSLVYIFCFWYVSPLYLAQGVCSIYFIVLSTDIVIGPLLTLLLYKTNKKKFIFDIVIIVILQISFFTYGLTIIEKGRVSWMVFVVDDIELVTPSAITNKKIPNDYKVGIIDKPIWVAAVYSKDPKIKQAQKEDEMFNGISLATRPETYQFLVTQRKNILRKLKSLDELQKYNDKEKIRQALKPYKDVEGWLPVKASVVDMVAIFDHGGKPLAIVNLRPWN